MVFSNVVGTTALTAFFPSKAMLLPIHLQQHGAALQAGTIVNWVMGVVGAVPGVSKGYTLYGKEGTLQLDLDSGRLQLGLKSDGGKLQEMNVEQDKIASWRA